ncbi:MAG: hypothetical protein Q7S88_01040 [Candidatus Daviesbacteria bacterium]|nr:hypothetical protein [Candidatus Daviesbacteria bacterium]
MNIPKGINKYGCPEKSPFNTWKIPKKVVMSEMIARVTKLYL